MALLKRKELRHLSELGNMPIFRADYSSLKAKYSQTQQWDSSANEFWNDPIIRNAFNVYQGAYVTFTASHTRTTLLNIVSGAGLLTHVLSPIIEQDGYSRQTLVFIITVDGFEYYQLVTKAESNMRTLLGGFRPFYAQTSAGQGASIDGSFEDFGFYNAPSGVTMVTPIQAESLGIGIPYKKSLKVEIILAGYRPVVTMGDRAGVMYVPK